MVPFVVPCLRTSTFYYKRRVQSNLGVVSLWVALCMVALYTSCETPPSNAVTYPDRAFNGLEWKKDSTGCSTYRANTCVSITKNEGFFRGKTQAFLLQFLGSPTFPAQTGKSVNSMAYVIECTALATPGAAPTAAPRATHASSPENAATLVFYLRNGVCTSVSIVEP